MSGLPVVFDVADQTVIMVGGGRRALPKIKRLIAARARVRLVAPKVAPAVADLASDKIEWVPRAFEAGDLAGATLVFSATGIPAVDKAVADAAARYDLPINVVDRPDLCRFTMPAIVDRDPVLVAISTGGAAPLLARRVRARIEALLPAKLGRLARFADRFRGAVRAIVPNDAARRRLWQKVFDGSVADAVLRGDEAAAGKTMLTVLNSVSAQGDLSGSVAIVGAGPGDSELLTLRAFRLLEQADVVIHDRLVGPEVLDLARRDAEFIPVGKQRGHHSVPQARINQLLAEHAQAGRRVVRLKGGDPFIFGRGGEELAYLRARNIPVEVVPGITAATGCAATAGLPLTHRDFARAVTFVSGEGKDGPIDADWTALANPAQTVCVYMGVAGAARIADRLVAHGRAPSTPVAVIENGTLPEQRLFRGTLDTLGALMRDRDIKAPSLVVIGAVAALADTERWPLEAASTAHAIAAE